MLWRSRTARWTTFLLLHIVAQGWPLVLRARIATIREQLDPGHGRLGAQAKAGDLPRPDRAGAGRTKGSVLPALRHETGPLAGCMNLPHGAWND